MTAVAVVISKRWDEWPFRVVLCSFAQNVLCNSVAGDPNMVLAGKVDLINWSIFLSPLMELQETILIRNFRNTA